MKRILILILLIAVLTTPVFAQELTAPPVPKQAEKFMPGNQKNFSEGLLEVLQDALMFIRPDLREASSVCMSLIAISLMVSIMHTFPGAPEKTVMLAGNIMIAVILFDATGSLVNLAGSTIVELSEYGKLLLPVMTAALAGQGGVGSSAAIYAGTAFFDALLTSMIRKILMPMVYVFLVLSVANNAIGEEIIKKLRDNMKWIVTWLLKTILYIYTGYIGISGLIAGSADATALKAAKLAISSFVPVVGKILSDASETVLLSANVVKNTAGVYGLFAILAIWIGPFFQIGVHYLLLKATGALCAVFSRKACVELIEDFSSALGLLLAMIGTICLMLLISLVCFLKGGG